MRMYLIDTNISLELLLVQDMCPRYINQSKDLIVPNAGGAHLLKSFPPINRKRI